MEREMQSETVDYDANQSPPNYQTTTGEAANHNINGGTAAVLTWAIPLVVALFLAATLLRKHPWKAWRTLP